MCVCVLSPPPPFLWKVLRGQPGSRGSLRACVLREEPCGSAPQGTVADGTPEAVLSWVEGPACHCLLGLLLSVPSSDGVRGGVPFPRGEEVSNGPRQLPGFSWAPCSCSCFVTTQPARRPRDSAFPASPTASCMLMHQLWPELAVVRALPPAPLPSRLSARGKGGASLTSELQSPTVLLFPLSHLV